MTKEEAIKYTSEIIETCKEHVTSCYGCPFLSNNDKCIVSDNYSVPTDWYYSFMKGEIK